MCSRCTPPVGGPGRSHLRKVAKLEPAKQIRKQFFSSSLDFYGDDASKQITPFSPGFFWSWLSAQQQKAN